MKKVLASLSLVALFVAFTAYSTACDSEGKCKGKSSTACCMSKASSKKSCCASKTSSEAKAETTVEPASTTVVPAKGESVSKVSVKTVSAPKANTNK